MSSSTTMRRRDLMRGLGLGAVFLAPFHGRVKAWAAGQAGQGNFIMFFTPNGHARSDFGADGNDAGFKFRAGMQAAEPMKAHISVVRGLSNKAQCDLRPFHSQCSRLLTVVSGNTKSEGSAFGPSIDQAVAELQGLRPLTQKVYWSRLTNSGTYQYLSWRGASLPNRLENDPRNAYKDVFGQFMPSGGDNGEVERLLAQRKSVLDLLKEDVKLYRGRLRSADQARLDVHMDALRELETRLSAAPSPGGGSCAMDAAKKAETTPPANDSGPYNVQAFKADGDIKASLLVTALACGARNSGLIMWQGAAGGINPNGGVGKADDHHWISHNEAPRSAWVALDNWYAGRFARLLQELESVGVLDDTVVVWGSDITEQHCHNNCTYVVGGGKSLGIKHQKTANFPFVGNENGGRAAARNDANRSLSDLWTTVYRACGGKSNFGEDVLGPIGEIWAPT